MKDNKSDRTMRILDYLQKDMPKVAADAKAEDGAEEEEESEEEKAKKRELEYKSEIPVDMTSDKKKKPAPGAFLV